MNKERLWEPIDFTENWRNADTSSLDNIASAWFERRKKLQNGSSEYLEFMERLKRRHAIETGVIERLYDIDRGVTETLIREGFSSSLLSHGSTNIDKMQLMHHLKDHIDAVDFVFDVVKDDHRPFTSSFICELHQLITRHQNSTEGRDQFGNNTNIPLIKGRYKELENNPTRDGTTMNYCPPEQTSSEMDNLIVIYNKITDDQVHPLIIAAWLHHAFTTIHPFQDGNGRVARLIASFVLIKQNYFPITVLREEAKMKYIEALEDADKGSPQRLVSYFGEIQRRNIEEAKQIK